ncbi:MAG: hypothetical protein KUG82_03970 [Pseudomonadales bacterium]|nr:hypothetical protein [Pseudomonadales bacterium]
MRVALIGRSELMYETAVLLLDKGFDITLIITCKEAPEYKIKNDDFAQLAKRIDAAYMYTASLGDSESLSFINKYNNCDIALSVNYSGVIPQKIINCFELGILNAHGGDLPRYRGNACQAWAILNGESKIGLCIHKMIGGELDSGDIVARDYLEININTKIGECYSWMEKRIPELFTHAVKQLVQNRCFVLETQSKEKQDALRCYPRRPEDGQINWKDSAMNIHRLINASSEPFLGAYAEYKGEKIIIWASELVLDDEVYLAVPGQITNLRVEDDYIVVATGDGKLKLKDIEYTGVRTKPNKFIKSIRQRLT